MQYFTKVMIPILLMVLFSCNRPVNSEGLEKYLNDQSNGTKKVYENGSFKAEMIYRPASVFVKREIYSGTTNVEAIKNKYKKYTYFVMNLYNNGNDLLNTTASNRALFSNINAQLSFKLNEFVYLLDKKNDTTHLSDFIFPHLYEASKTTSVLLAFKTEDIKTNMFKICIKDIGFGTDIIEFEFSKKDLENVPTLKF